MSDLRIFLAHDRATPDEKIDDWRDILTDLLSEAYPDRDVTVVAGRDDYKKRAAEAGGWKAWPQTVVSGALWDGAPRFHGIVRPAQYVEQTDVTAGRPTFEMIEGFRREGKNAWVWDTRTDEIFDVASMDRLPGDSFKVWGRIIVEQN